MDLGLKGKSVLITGGSKGIGLACAGSFAAEGARLHLAARDGDRLNRAKSDVGGDVILHPCDLRDPDALRKLATECADVDILVNNAGDIPGGTIEMIDDAKWRHAWELKVFGYIDLSRLLYARMKARGHGVIINDIGAAGERLDFDYIAGSTGNAALMAFTRALGGRSVDDGIRVVGINPGPVDTDRIVTLMRTRAKAVFGDEERYRELMAKFPCGRAARVREIADAVAFLASDRSAYTSGVIYTIDGGLCARTSVL